MSRAWQVGSSHDRLSLQKHKQEDGEKRKRRGKKNNRREKNSVGEKEVARVLLLQGTPNSWIALPLHFLLTPFISPPSSCIDTHRHTQTNTHTYAHTKTHTQAQSYILTHTLPPSPRARTHTHTHTHTHTQHCKHTPTHTHARTHTHTHHIPWALSGDQRIEESPLLPPFPPSHPCGALLTPSHIHTHTHTHHAGVLTQHALHGRNHSSKCCQEPVCFALCVSDRGPCLSFQFTLPRHALRFTLNCGHTHPGPHKNISLESSKQRESDTWKHTAIQESE